MRSTYEGWPNFETWCVNRAANRPHDARYWRSVARWHASEAKALFGRRLTCREARHVARVALAGELSGHFYANRPPPLDDPYADLLSAALDAADYVAIADRFLGEFLDDSEPQAEGPDGRDRPTGGLTFETFTVLEWIRFDGLARCHWNGAARDCLDEARRKPAPEGTRAAVTEMLAEALRDQVPGKVAGAPKDVRHTLIDCALARVHWGQLARRLIRDYGLFGANGPASERKG